jgi:hypothetical protein
MYFNNVSDCFLSLLSGSPILEMKNAFLLIALPKDHSAEPSRRHRC